MLLYVHCATRTGRRDSARKAITPRCAPRTVWLSSTSASTDNAALHSEGLHAARRHAAFWATNTPDAIFRHQNILVLDHSNASAELLVQPCATAAQVRTQLILASAVNAKDTILSAPNPPRA